MNPQNCLTREHFSDEYDPETTYGWCPECGMWSDNQGFGITDESECDHCGGPIDETILYQGKVETTEY